MNIDYNFFKVSDGHSLAYKKWEKTTSPKEIIIIVHGMAEHIERYDELANRLNSFGYLVYGTDQRGHGKTSGKKGFFTHNYGDNRVIQDQEEFYDYIKSKNPNLPISYIAHSMGSFILRKTLSRSKIDIKKVILSGTGFQSYGKTKIAIQLAKLITFFKGKTTEAGYLDKIVNGPLSKSVENPVTNFDWLSRDKNEVSKYINDSNCGFKCTNQFFTDFFKIISYSCNSRNIKKIDKELPILLYSGDRDPVGGLKGSDVKKLKKLYIKHNLNVHSHFNSGGRHESINEINREMVYTHFIDFLEKVN